MATLKEKYTEEILPRLLKESGFKNPMEAPKLSKVTINMGLGEAVQDPKLIAQCQEDVAAITGQKAVATRAKKSIANFKLRQGLPIGVRVTLRRDRMYDFVERLVSIAIPRIKDFRGISPRGFDGHGNYTLGLKDQMLFPEIEYDQVYKPKGMNITFVTTAKTDLHARMLLEQLGLPFRKG